MVGTSGLAITVQNVLSRPPSATLRALALGPPNTCPWVQAMKFLPADAFKYMRAGLTLWYLQDVGWPAGACARKRCLVDVNHDLRPIRQQLPLPATSASTRRNTAPNTADSVAPKVGTQTRPNSRSRLHTNTKGRGPVFESKSGPNFWVPTCVFLAPQGARCSSSSARMFARTGKRRHPTPHRRWKALAKAFRRRGHRRSRWRKTSERQDARQKAKTPASCPSPAQR